MGSTLQLPGQTENSGPDMGAGPILRHFPINFNAGRSVFGQASCHQGAETHFPAVCVVAVVVVTVVAAADVLPTS